MFFPDCYLVRALNQFYDCITALYYNCLLSLKFLTLMCITVGPYKIIIISEKNATFSSALLKDFSH